MMSQDDSSLIIVRIERLEALLDDVDTGSSDSLGSRLGNLVCMVEGLERSTRELDRDLDSRIECVQAAEVERLEAYVADLRDRLVEQTENVQSEVEEGWRKLDEECAELRHKLGSLELSAKLQSADILELNQDLAQEIADRTEQTEELEEEIHRLRKEIEAKDALLQSFDARYAQDEDRIDLLWAEINRLRADLDRVGQAAVTPSTADHFLSFMIGLTIMCGLGWLAFKAVSWLYGLIR
jgi:chromosome segregation ATPase